MFWRLIKQETMCYKLTSHLNLKKGLLSFLFSLIGEACPNLRRRGEGRVVAGFVILFTFFMTPVFAVDQNKVDSLFSVATETLNEGPLSKSIKAFKRVLSADDCYAPAHEQIARLYLQQDTPDSRRVAEKVIRRAINLGPNNPTYQLLLGDVMLFRGFRHNAGEHYDKVMMRPSNG